MLSPQIEQLVQFRLATKHLYCFTCGQLTTRMTCMLSMKTFPNNQITYLLSELGGTQGPQLTCKCYSRFLHSKLAIIYQQENFLCPLNRIDQLLAGK